MKQRFVIVAITTSGDVGSDEVYGTWQTYDAAKAQADIWERKADRLTGIPGEMAFEVKQLHPKTRSRALAELWTWLKRDAS